jgi:hypothetical protein
MTKAFIRHESRIHHHNACIAGNDFGNCFDRAAHPIAIILLRCFGISQPAINVLFNTMETMRLFLHTGFGESTMLYGGTHEEWLAGFGQINAAAGPGFTAMSLLITKGYLHNGFGAKMYSSYYKWLLLLPACSYAR